MTELPEPGVLDAAYSIWRYHCLDEMVAQEASSYDLIIGLGSYDTRVADYCADLYHMGLASTIVFTGASGNWTRAMYEGSEAAAFFDVAVEKCVPPEHIMLEEKATNTGENISNVKAMFPDCRSALFVTKPQMQRRCRATIEKIWPELHSSVTAPSHSILSQPVGEIDLQKVIHEIVGDYWRIRTYPKRGFQTEQQIDEAAEEAFNMLIEQGYTKHLPSDWQDELNEINAGDEHAFPASGLRFLRRE